jgi:hypothetical protein
MTLTTLDVAAKEAAKIYINDREKQTAYMEFINGAQWQQSQNTWKFVSEKTPPIDCQLIAQNPDGINFLTEWRESYKIFTCQAKSESSLDWKWKLI